MHKLSQNKFMPRVQFCMHIYIYIYVIKCQYIMNVFTESIPKYSNYEEV